jgi:hypothetical protein
VRLSKTDEVGCASKFNTYGPTQNGFQRGRGYALAGVSRYVVSGCLIAQWNMSALSLGVFTRDKLGLYLKNVIELEGIHFR